MQTNEKCKKSIHERKNYEEVIQNRQTTLKNQKETLCSSRGLVKTEFSKSNRNSWFHGISSKQYQATDRKQKENRMKRTNSSPGTHNTHVRMTEDVQRDQNHYVVNK